MVCPFAVRKLAGLYHRLVLREADCLFRRLIEQRHSETHPKEPGSAGRSPGLARLLHLKLGLPAVTSA
jgi:hypothetical protein